METAKIFWSGRSQAVRLPKAYRFQTDQVRIRRQGRAVVLEPVEQGWEWLQAVTGPVDTAFESAVREQPAEQERAGMGELFK